MAISAGSGFTDPWNRLCESFILACFLYETVHPSGSAMPFAGHVSNVLFPLQGFVKPLLGPVSGNVTQGVFDLFVKLKIKSVQLKPFISLFPCCFPLAREGLG